MITYLRFAAVALIPALINTALAVHFFTTPSRNSLPYYNDEIAYWNQVATFREAGFGGGYITANERPSPLTWSRFGPHGPTFPVIYGSLARVTGWRPSTAVDLNLFLITVATFVWLVSTRPPLRLAIVLLATFWPLALALTTTMQEPLQYALVLLLAATIQTAVRPDPAEVRSDHALVRPDQASVRSDSTMVRSDRTEVRSDRTEVRPDRTEVRPDRTEVRPDHGSVRSGSTMVRSDGTGVRSDRTEVRPDQASVRSDRTEVRSDRTEVRSDPTEVRSDHALVRPDQASVRSDPTEVRSDRTEVRSDPTEVRSDHALVRSDRTEGRSDRTEGRSDHALVRPDQASVRSDSAMVRSEQTGGRSDRTEGRSDHALVRPDQASVRRSHGSVPPGQTSVRYVRADVAFGIVITIASLLRPSWALLLVPYLADRAGGSPLRRWGARAAGLVVSVAAYALFFVVLGAPYPGGPGSRLSDLLGNPAAALGSIAVRLAGNIGRFLSTRDAAVLEVFFRYEALVLWAALVVLLVRRRGTPGDAAYRLLTIAAWFLGLTLAGTLAAGDIESWRDYRVLTSVLFLTLLLAVHARWRPARFFIAAHLLLLPAAAATFTTLYEPKFRADRTRVAAFAEQAASVMTFERGAAGWTNTVLVPVDRYEYPLLGIPPGIGASSFFGWEDIALPLKSRYLLLHAADRESAPPGVRLRKLRDTVHGTLYENLDAAVSPAAK